MRQMMSLVEGIQFDSQFTDKTKPYRTVIQGWLRLKEGRKEGYVFHEEPLGAARSVVDSENARGGYSNEALARGVE